MHEQFVNKSISAALSAIEIYNKPDFRYRNEIFTILIVNAWELLLKGKILLDRGDKIEAIYVTDSHGNIKTNRNNSPLTVEIIGAMNEANLDSTIKDNILTLLEIRDTAIHFVNAKQIDYLIYSLGTACLKNYQRLVKDWFVRDLLEYNFYILPLGFSHNFKTFTLIEIDKEPEIIQNLLANITSSQEKRSENGFHFTCEIEIHLRSAKKVTEATDLVAAVDPNAKDVITVIRTQKLTEKYPLSYDELWRKVKASLGYIKQNDFNRFIRQSKLKDNDKYSAYHFRYNKYEEEYKKTGRVTNGTPSLYNEDCARHMISELPNFLK